MRGTTWRRAAIGIGVAAVTLGLSVVPSAAQHSDSAGPGAGTLATIVISGRLVPAGSGLFIPPKVGAGDADYSGNGPKVVASAVLDVQRTRLLVNLCIHAKETKSDHTEAAGCLNFVLLDTPAGQCIQGVDRGRFDALSYVDSDHARDEFGRQVSGSFVQHWTVAGDDTGNDAGLTTGVQLITDRILVLTESC